MKELDLMQKYHGKSWEYTSICGTCCNCWHTERGADKRYCIAFGKEYCGAPWPEDGKACGLYNTPFAAIRPRILPLGEYLERTRRTTPAKQDPDQDSLFAGGENNDQENQS